MAGYDFEFEVPARYREAAQQWMKSFKRLARSLALDVHYSTNLTGQGQAQIYVTVDGSLYAIQHLHRRLIHDALQYAVMSDKAKIMGKILPKFVVAYKEGVCHITDEVFEVASMFGSDAAHLIVSKELLARAEGCRTRLNKSIQTIVQAMDNWAIGELSGENTVILCDQGIEDCLKALLELPSSSRDGFRDVLDKALKKGIISRMEEYRLRRFHETRNRVQHRGGRVRSETVLSMLSYCFRLVDQKLGENWHILDSTEEI